MYLRFVVTDIDEDSEREPGVFRAVGNLRDREELFMEEARATSSYSPAAYPLIAAGEAASIVFPRFLGNGVF
jgi:hypothetical protein